MQWRALCLPQVQTGDCCFFCAVAQGPVRAASDLATPPSPLCPALRSALCSALRSPPPWLSPWSAWTPLPPPPHTSTSTHALPLPPPASRLLPPYCHLLEEVLAAELHTALEFPLRKGEAGGETGTTTRCMHVQPAGLLPARTASSSCPFTSKRPRCSARAWNEPCTSHPLPPTCLPGVVSADDPFHHHILAQPPPTHTRARARCIPSLRFPTCAAAWSDAVASKGIDSCWPGGKGAGGAGFWGEGVVEATAGCQGALGTAGPAGRWPAVRGGGWPAPIKPFALPHDALGHDLDRPPSTYPGKSRPTRIACPAQPCGWALPRGQPLRAAERARGRAARQ